MYPSFIKDDFIKKHQGSLWGLILQSNHWLYSIFWTLGGSLFFSYYFRLNFQNEKHKRIVKYLTVLFILSFAIYYATHFEKLFSDFIFIPVDIFSAVLVATCSILYLMELMQSDKIVYFYRSINFYISTVILIWWLISTPINFFNEYFHINDIDFITLQWLIYLIINVMMYLSFTFALIFCQPRIKDN